MNLFAKRPRHFHDGPDDDANSKKAKTSDKMPYLYQHAVESIFVFLDLGELATVVAVDRAWNRAVSSMRSISADLRPKQSMALVDICASPLARHIGTLSLFKYRGHSIASHETLYLLYLCMPRLRELSCEFPKKFADGAIHFPQTLRSLYLLQPATLPANTKRLILAASRLTQLESFSLNMLDASSELKDLVDLSPFTNSSSLRHISIDKASTNAHTPYTPLQLAQLRDIPHLESITSNLVVEEVRVLLKTPHQLQLKSLFISGRIDGISELLATTPTLTNLDVVRSREMSFAFLHSAPQLRSLKLVECALGAEEESVVNTEKLLAGCTWPLLTSLKFDTMANLTSAHIRCLVSRMPALTKLRLSGLNSLESLECLSANGSALSQSLTQLNISECPLLGANDLKYVATLKQLVKLTISGAFVASLDGWSLSQLEVPSLVLPNLVESDIYE